MGRWWRRLIVLLRSLRVWYTWIDDGGGRAGRMVLLAPLFAKFLVSGDLALTYKLVLLVTDSVFVGNIRV